MWERTLDLIPNGVQTESKMPSRHVEGVYPKYIEYGDGAYIYADGKRYIDFPCGLGAIILGHNHPDINLAISKQLKKGHLFPLPNILESELAEKLCGLIPSFEMVRFLKTGSEATQAAIRIARAHTEREVILSCGYHGWHNWYAESTDNKHGMPVRKRTCFQFKYNDLEGFKELFDQYKIRIAAVIMEPYILEEPKNHFLESIHKMCIDNGSLLIFDEVVTGFRTPGMSAQMMFKVIPDLSCFGKAMANGMPISVVGGKRDIMRVLEKKAFVSSTFGGELLSIAAALATIKYIEDKAVLAHIEGQGQKLKTYFNQKGREIGAECIGYPCRTFFKFPSEILKSLFWQECLRKGIFFGYAQFISAAHGVGEMDETVAAMRDALYMCRKYKNDPGKILHGTPASATNRLQEDK